MTEITRILCIVDPQQPDSPAVQRAVWLARSSGAALELLAVCYDESILGRALDNQSIVDQSRAQALDETRRRLSHFAELLQREKKIAIEANAVWDRPLHEGIVRYANDSGADFVFKDAQHHSALHVAILSNQDWQLIRCCPQPLWIVKRDALPESLRFVAAVDPLHKHDKPAALDDAILKLGRSLTLTTGAALHAFHSFDPRIAMSAAEHNVYIPVSLPLSDIEEQMREQHAVRFEQVVDPYEIKDSRMHLVTGLADEELPRLAARLDAVAVIMGAIARNPIKRLFIGSTAERTLNRLPSDLIVVKPDWFESPILSRDEALREDSEAVSSY